MGAKWAREGEKFGIVRDALCYRDSCPGGTATRALGTLVWSHSHLLLKTRLGAVEQSQMETENVSFQLKQQLLHENCRFSPSMKSKHHTYLVILNVRESSKRHDTIDRSVSDAVERNSGGDNFSSSKPPLPRIIWALLRTPEAHPRKKSEGNFSEISRERKLGILSPCLSFTASPALTLVVSVDSSTYTYLDCLSGAHSRWSLVTNA